MDAIGDVCAARMETFNGNLNTIRHSLYARSESMKHLVEKETSRSRSEQTTRTVHSTRDASIRKSTLSSINFDDDSSSTDECTEEEEFSMDHGAYRRSYQAGRARRPKRCSRFNGKGTIWQQGSDYYYNAGDNSGENIAACAIVEKGDEHPYTLESFVEERAKVFSKNIQFAQTQAEELTRNLGELAAEEEQAIQGWFEDRVDTFTKNVEIIKTDWLAW